MIFDKFFGRNKASDTPAHEQVMDLVSALRAKWSLATPHELVRLANAILALRAPSAPEGGVAASAASTRHHDRAMEVLESAPETPAALAKTLKAYETALTAFQDSRPSFDAARRVESLLGFARGYLSQWHHEDSWHYLRQLTAQFSLAGLRDDMPQTISQLIAITRDEEPGSPERTAGVAAAHTELDNLPGRMAREKTLILLMHATLDALLAARVEFLCSRTTQG